MTAALGRAVRAFGRFWWEFLVGDTPELFFATLMIVGAAFLLRHDHLAGVILLPLLAAVVLVASAYRGRKRATGPGDQPVAGEDVEP